MECLVNTTAASSSIIRPLVAALCNAGELVIARETITTEQDQFRFPAWLIYWSQLVLMIVLIGTYSWEFSQVD